MRQVHRLTFVLAAWLLPWTAGAQLLANFSASATNACPPAVIQFTDLSTGNPTGWTWDFGNGTVISGVQNPSVSYLTAGNYTVTLTITNGAASNTKVINGYIHINPPPAADFNANSTAACPGTPFSFNSQVTLNAPGAGTYSWDFGNGAFASTANATYTYYLPGFYNISFLAVNATGCSTIVNKPGYIQVYTPPVNQFTANPLVICQPGGSTTFTNTTTGSGPLSYQWNFGDGGSSTQQNPTHSYASIGVYTVQLITTDAHGCKDTLVKPAYVSVTQFLPNFTGPSAICEDDLANFTNTTPNTSSLTWHFGDGASGSGANVYHIYANPGTYQVTLLASNAGCADSAVKSILVYPKPQIQFSSAPLAPCPAPATIQFNNTSSGAAGFIWKFGDGNFSNQQNPSHTYTANGLYDVVLIATSPQGCTDSLRKQAEVKIYPLELNILANKTEGCFPFPVNFSAQVIYGQPILNIPAPYPYPVTSYSWDFGDGFFSTAATPSHTYTQYGTFTVTLTITTANGCTKTNILVIHSGSPPVAGFTGTPTTVCVNEKVTFTSNSSGNVTDWYWQFGDGGSSVLPNPQYAYGLPGVYTVILTVGNNGCYDSMQRLNYITVNFPKSIFAPGYSCDTPLKVNFANSSIGYTSCKWYFGDGNSSTAPSPSHIYPALGFYNVSLVTWNSGTGCKDSVTHTIQLLQLQPSFAASDSTICKDETIFFASAVSGGAATAFTWQVGGQYLPDTTAILYYTFTQTGRFTVVLTVKDQHNCLRSVSRINYMLVAKPMALFTASPPYGCAPALITFTDQSVVVPGAPVVSRHWDFGDQTSQTTTAASVSHAYPNVGNYDIKLYVTDNIGCKDSLILPGYLQVRDPVASFGANTTTACVGVPFHFTNASQGTQLSYFWDFGDGDTGSALLPVHIYQQPGTYTVRLVILDNIGCRDTMTRLSYITVSPRPDASFTASDTFAICPPLVVHFTNTSTGGIQNAWSLGNGNNSNLQHPTTTYTGSGIYNVRLIMTNGAGCKDTAIRQVRILGYAGVMSYAPLTGCSPLTVQFTAHVTNVPGFIYDFNDGFTAATSDTTITHIYTRPGSHVPRLIMTDNQGCSSSSVGLDTIRVDGIYQGFTFSPYPACDHGTIQFIDTSTGAFSVVNSRFWQFHDGSSSTQAGPSKTYPAPGTYSVILISSTTTGCKDTLVSSVTFWPLPKIDAGADTIICRGDSATLNPSGGVSYTWQPAGTLNCTACTHPKAGPVVRTVYIATGKDAQGCTNTDTVTVDIRTKTDGEAGPGGEICQGVSFRLNASGGTTYTWLPPEGLNNPFSSSPLATPGSSIRYMVITKLASCEADTDYVDLVVHPKPTVHAGPDQTMIAGNSVQLQATGSSIITGFEWMPFETLSCRYCPDPEARPKRTTDYIVVARTDFNCTDTDVVTVFVICENSQIYLPNTFTPDGNGRNDLFYPHGKGISMIKSFRIYDRWGELIFERREVAANDSRQGWDGSFKGAVLPPDVYVYVVEALCDTGEDVKWQGDVMLLR